MAKQGVLIKHHFDNRDELEQAVTTHTGRVFVRDGSHHVSQPMAYVRLLSARQQRDEAREAASSMMFFGGSTDHGPTVVLDNLEGGISGPGTYFLRPKTKKALREAVADDPSSVYVEAMAGMPYDEPDYGGPLSEAPNDQRFTIVGPLPGSEHNWWATIRWSERKKGWMVE